MRRHQASSLFAADQKPKVRLRCPYCRHQGTFDEAQPADSYDGKGPADATYFVVRLCPNTECGSVVFVVCDQRGGIEESFPAETIDFDATSLPPTVLESLDEATRCLAAGCYRAGALMVRRTLEDLCHEREATGPNLQKRLERLRDKVVVPQELLDGLQSLRLLGNDAGHIEARTYEHVGEEEVILALDVAKEVLKAVYQYGSLVERLEQLKQSTDE